MNLKELTIKTFCISYDLRGEDCNYKDLTEKLEELSGRNILQSVWILKSNTIQTCEELKNELKTYIKEKDGLYVAKIEDHAFQNLDYPLN